MAKALLLVSACLAGIPCRYDGGHSLVAELAALCAEGRALPVCPEVDGGLPVPRPPCELRKGRAFTENGEDLTARYLLGAERARETALRHGIRLAVLKAKSPSCGTSLIYDGTFSGRLAPGEGIAAKLLREAGITLLRETDMAILHDAIGRLEYNE